VPIDPEWRVNFEDLKDRPSPALAAIASAAGASDQ
jgi:hypothetical protein